MTDIIFNNTYITLLLPLWFFLIIMCGRFFSVRMPQKIINLFTLSASFFGAVTCFLSLLKIKEPLVQSFPFIKINDFVIYAGLHTDKFSLMCALVLFAVSFLVQMFSISYMKNESKNYRFFAYLNMFNFSMAGFLFSPNLFQMYVFWEVTGIISYLLIGFDYKNNEKSEAAKRVLIMNKIGDTAFLAGILAVSYFMYNYAGNFSFASLSFEDINGISVLLRAYTSTPEFYVICALFIIAGAVKSAQFPFYTWLQDAMEAALPVSALLHSASMVAMGVYMVIRLLPIFDTENNLLIFIAGLGLFTAFLCSILASTEKHPKKILAYSTSASLGLMFLGLGFLNMKAATVFFAVHAVTKSMLFLLLDLKNTLAGKIIFLLGALSLSGLLFSGLTAKEILYAPLSGGLALVYCLISFITAFYIVRLALSVMRSGQENSRADLPEYFSVSALLVLNIILYIFMGNKLSYKLAEPFWSALMGFGAAYILYRAKFELPDAPRLLEKIYNNIFPKIYFKISEIFNYIDTKILGNYKPLKISAKLGIKSADFIETNIVSKSINLVSEAVKKISAADSMLQDGNVQTYNAFAFVFVTFAICFVITVYVFILNQMGVI